ncbi:hypothetical protein MSAR_05980 [Mycolicibacterium sarraceniae]|uniref:Uncharacterized protein n=1 Tax=Mycolicibacterium sarraceniae TaxID=1534348 RepID=A0A7I7SKJ2_9MYCO|nr:hypothetical protein MSAR_05980 [Mycolicibacterium sarraceniae]
MGGRERGDHRQHRGGLGPVTLQRRDRQWHARRMGEQSEGDVWVQPSLAEPRFAEPVTGIGLDVQVLTS